MPCPCMQGPHHRLRRKLHALQQGKPLRLSAVGGSISWGSGVTRGLDDWLTLLTEYLQASSPAANITSVNGCVPATGSAFMNL